MTDRELLELAAKAAGIELYDCQILGLCRKEKVGELTIDVIRWNPLTDDGDALRLAVKLRLFSNAEFADQFSWPSSWGDADPYAATRRAIVRAAAEIGKEMK